MDTLTGIGERLGLQEFCRGAILFQRGIIRADLTAVDVQRGQRRILGQLFRCFGRKYTHLLQISAIGPAWAAAK